MKLEASSENWYNIKTQIFAQNDLNWANLLKNQNGFRHEF
jgi:hypothetical protein